MHTYIYILMYVYIYIYVCANMRYWFYYSTQLAFPCHPNKMVGWNLFVPIRYKLPMGTLSGLALQYFYMIYRVGG